VTTTLNLTASLELSLNNIRQVTGWNNNILFMSLG